MPQLLGTFCKLFGEFGCRLWEAGQKPIEDFELGFLCERLFAAAAVVSVAMVQRVQDIGAILLRQKQIRPQLLRQVKQCFVGTLACEQNHTSCKSY